MSGLFPSASRLGFGCASLGSRVGRRAGLNALGQAFDAGVNWFDLAPAYGDGNAEAIFAQFARGRRDNIHICTKCGIAPPKTAGWRAAVRPLARAVVEAFPGARRLASRGRAASERLPLSAALIRESLDSSLARLQTDHVDVIALHDPVPEDLERADVLRALEDAVRSGKARTAGVAGSLAAARMAGAQDGPIGHLQFAEAPGDDGLGGLLRSLPLAAERFHIVTHSVGRLAQGLAQDANVAAMLRELGYTQPIAEALRAAALDYALSSNIRGTVLLSMFSPRHMAFNLARAEASAAVDASGLSRLFSTASVPRHG